MKQHKYVRKEYGFIVFPETMQHSDFKKHNEDVLSAGFCYIDTEKQECKCFGESISLKLKSLPEDSERMTRQFFSYY